MMISFSLVPMYLLRLLTLCFPTEGRDWLSNDNLLSVLISSKVADFSDVTLASPIFKNYLSFILLFLFVMIAWHLSGFTIISLCLKQSIVILFSASNFYIMSFIVSSIETISLPSAKLGSSFIDIQIVKYWKVLDPKLILEAHKIVILEILFPI